jgi:hypothetical protein
MTSAQSSSSHLYRHLGLRDERNHVQLVLERLAVRFPVVQGEDLEVHCLHLALKVAQVMPHHRNAVAGIAD